MSDRAGESAAPDAAGPAPTAEEPTIQQVLPLREQFATWLALRVDSEIVTLLEVLHLELRGRASFVAADHCAGAAVRLAQEIAGRVPRGQPR